MSGESQSADSVTTSVQHLTNEVKIQEKSFAGERADSRTGSPYTEHLVMRAGRSPERVLLRVLAWKRTGNFSTVEYVRVVEIRAAANRPQTPHRRLKAFVFILIERYRFFDVVRTSMLHLVGSTQNRAWGRCPNLTKYPHRPGYLNART